MLMGNRGRSLHVRGLTLKRAEAALPKLGVSFAMLGCNERWMSIAPLDDDGSLDVRLIAKKLRLSVLQIWSDDDAGIVYQLYTAIGIGLELTISPDHGEVPNAAAGDRGWIEHAVVTEVISETIASEFHRRLSASSREVAAWATDRGVENLFDLPFGEPLPARCDEATVRQLAPGARIIAGRAGASKAREPKPPLPATTRQWSTRERAVVDLHFDYLTSVWTLNDWKLYSRYKKHLPAEFRHEVDRLVDITMRHKSADEVRLLLESILGTVWDADDWLAVIADPELGRYDTVERQHLDAWRERVAQVVEAANAELPTPTAQHPKSRST